MREQRNYRRSKDGASWSKITFLRMKQDAWKFHSPFLALELINLVRGGTDTTFSNGYIYGRIPNQAQEAIK